LNLLPERKANIIELNHVRRNGYIKKKNDLTKEHYIMKSTAKKLLTTTGLLVTLLISLAGCSSQSTSMEEKKYIIPAQKIDTLTIDVKDKKINILQSKDEQIHIVYYESEKDFYKIDLSDDKELSMVSDSNKEWKTILEEKARK